MPTVLTLLADGFEEIEAATPVDLLRRAGADVFVASTGPGIHVTGRSGITVHADGLLADQAARRFDCLFLPGGPGVARLRKDAEVLARVRRQHAEGGWLAAICAAPVILVDAGVLCGRRYTAHPSVLGEMPDAPSPGRFVTDGRLVTSQGAGTALDFGLALVSHLFSAEVSASIAAAICA